MAPDWSDEKSEVDDPLVVESVTESVGNLLQVELPKLSWFDIQRWRFAHPASAVDVSALRCGEEVGLFFAGDALVGQGRIPRAMETGFECAARIAQIHNL
ncbi:MAG: renalase [Verrucomicrobiales bacterium]|jgi:renalase